MGVRVHVFFCAAVLWLAVLCASARPAQATDLIGPTHLLTIHDDTGLSRMVATLSTKGYALSGGAPQRFDLWYGTNWRDVSAQWMTTLGHETGLLWGISTGEHGAKYRIAPGLHLGFLWQFEPSAGHHLSLSARTILGGRLREDSCRADFGAIAQGAEVNCRLAASPLSPQAGLSQKLDLAPRSGTLIALTYQIRF